MKWQDAIENGKIFAVTYGKRGRVIGKVLAVPITIGRKKPRTVYAFYAAGIYGGVSTFTEAKQMVEYIAPIRIERGLA